MTARGDCTTEFEPDRRFTIGMPSRPCQFGTTSGGPSVQPVLPPTRQDAGGGHCPLLEAGSWLMECGDWQEETGGLIAVALQTLSETGLVMPANAALAAVVAAIASYERRRAV